MRKKIVYKTGDKLHPKSLLTYLSESPPAIHKSKTTRRALFSCVCGNVTESQISNIKSGSTISCGCFLASNRFTHSMSKTPEYHAWNNMIQRCTYIKHTSYKNYGGRGISVCDRWLKFENFYEDMGARPSDSHSIDRINNSGNYEHSNCRWATKTEQVRNARSNHNITYNGETHCIAEWAEITGLHRDTIRNRVDKGLQAKQVLRRAENRKRVNITFNGETKSRTAWAKELGLNPTTLRYRIKNWGLHSAMTTPHRYASPIDTSTIAKWPEVEK